MNALLKGMLIASGIGVGGLLAGRALLRRSRWFSFRGKRVLVTGGARGLGLVLARQLIDAGAKVAICARTPSQLHAAEEELQQRGDVISFRCDVRNRDDVLAMVERILDAWQGVDVLFNVAGVIQVGPMDTMTLDDFHQAMDTHCWGVLNTVQAVLPFMRGRGWGRIVNIASLGGKRAVPHMLPYAASKFALVGLSNGLRTELAREGILVTTVCPGLMRTGSPRNATFKGKHREEYAWFSIGDSLPLVSLDATRAATKILRACQQGDSEVIITGLANLAVWLQAMAPNLTTEILSLVNCVLPENGGIGQSSAKGYESESELSPSWMTRLGDEAARRNNELTPARGEQLAGATLAGVSESNRPHR